MQLKHFVYTDTLTHRHTNTHNNTHCSLLIAWPRIGGASRLSSMPIKPSTSNWERSGGETHHQSRASTPNESYCSDFVTSGLLISSINLCQSSSGVGHVVPPAGLPAVFKRLPWAVRSRTNGCHAHFSTRGKLREQRKSGDCSDCYHANAGHVRESVDRAKLQRLLTLQQCRAGPALSDGKIYIFIMFNY